MHSKEFRQFQITYGKYFLIASSPTSQQKLLSCLMCPILCGPTFVSFSNPLAPDIQIHVSWGTRLPNVCTQSGHLAAIKHYKSPIASLIYERPLVGSFKVYHALLGLISFTRYGDDAKPKMQLDVCCLSGSGLFLGRSEPWGALVPRLGSSSWAALCLPRLLHAIDHHRACMLARRTAHRGLTTFSRYRR